MTNEQIDKQIAALEAIMADNLGNIEVVAYCVEEIAKLENQKQ